MCASVQECTPRHIHGRALARARIFGGDGSASKDDVAVVRFNALPGMYVMIWGKTDRCHTSSYMHRLDAKERCE
eukprot:1669455-Pleurochrysis_carterae.AAC.2